VEDNVGDFGNEVSSLLSELEEIDGVDELDDVDTSLVFVVDGFKEDVKEESGGVKFRNPGVIEYRDPALVVAEEVLLLDEEDNLEEVLMIE